MKAWLWTVVCVVQFKNRIDSQSQDEWFPWKGATQLPSLILMHNPHRCTRHTRQPGPASNNVIGDWAVAVTWLLYLMNFKRLVRNTVLLPSLDLLGSVSKCLSC